MLVGEHKPSNQQITIQKENRQMLVEEHKPNNRRLTIKVVMLVSLLGLVIGIGALAMGVSAAAPPSLPTKEVVTTSTDSAANNAPNVPLESLLNKDGTLKLKTGFTGSVDPAGWKMETGPNGRPRFVKAGEQQGQQQAATKPRSATSSPMVSGDENWDDRF